MPALVASMGRASGELEIAGKYTWAPSHKRAVMTSKPHEPRVSPPCLSLLLRHSMILFCIGKEPSIEPQSKPGTKMVNPEPCFNSSEGGYPRLFLAGIRPYEASSTRGFEDVAHIKMPLENTPQYSPCLG